MLRNIEGVIFDLDGTLIDSMWMWKDIDIEYLGRFGYELPDNLQDIIEGMSYTETANYFKETFRLPCDIDEIKEDWNKMAYDKYVNQVPLKPGALDFIKYLKESGRRLGIATSNGTQLVEAIMKVHGLESYFSSIRTACDVAHGKPSPDIYLKVAEDLEVSPNRCLAFEDVPMGILAGNRAGMKVCAVYDEFSAHQENEKRKLADYYIRQFDYILTEKYEVLNHE